jgi:hypothetical protein
MLALRRRAETTHPNHMVLTITISTAPDGLTKSLPKKEERIATIPYLLLVDLIQRWSTP